VAKRVRVRKTSSGQIIELPPEFAIDADSVEIAWQGDSIVLAPVRSSWLSPNSESGEFEEWWDDLTI
jgi:virulence-associated protein VagC